MSATSGAASPTPGGVIGGAELVLVQPKGLENNSDKGRTSQPALDLSVPACNATKEVYINKQICICKKFFVSLKPS